MKVLFAGGGTGGHLYPAIAIADALRSRASIAFVGTADRLEGTIVPQAGYDLETVEARPVTRGFSIGMLQTIAANAVGTLQAMRLLLRLRPDAVIATGGYVCFPVVAAAKILRLTMQVRAAIALLEPNAQPGLTNRLLAPLVDEIWSAFACDPSLAKKCVRTGMPVRAALFRPNNRIEAARRLGLDPGRRTILVVGGSQGARSINQAVAALVTRRELPPDWQILHVSGERDYAYMQAEERAPFGGNRVVLLPYLRDMADAYALCELAIARAGASTVWELAALGVASILVPYPFAAEQHQLRNARAFEAAGACVVIEDRELSADSLWWTLRSAMDPQRLSSLRAAARSLADRDPVATILARIDVLTSRKTGRA